MTALLVARAQLGDRAALDGLLREVQAPLYAHLRLLLGDDDAAEDALQDALLAICRGLGGLRDPRWFRAWAWRVATRVAVRQSRRSRRAPLDLWAPEELDRVPAYEPDARFDAELLAALPPALDALSPASRVVLRMHYVDELTHREIAEALELSVGTVKSRLAYGLAALRKAVGAPAR